MGNICWRFHLCSYINFQSHRERGNLSRFITCSQSVITRVLISPGSGKFYSSAGEEGRTIHWGGHAAAEEGT